MKLQNTTRNKFSIMLILAMFSLALPIICAAQEKIIFTSGRDGDLELFSMKPDGTLPTQLTTNTATDFQPSASLDGTRIAFTSERDFNSEIYIMNADGSGQTNLTNNFATDRDPAISPDGSRIVFVSNRFGGFQIFIMDADGSNPTPLTFGIQPSFSPDGTKIVYVSGDGDYEIFTININGTNKTQITQNAAIDLFPKFSPDGNSIAFISDRDGDTAVYIMNADSTNQTRLSGTLTNIFDSNDLSFSPDGSKVAFTSYLDGNYEIYTIETSGINLNRVTNNFFSDFQPFWAGLPIVTPVFNAPTDLHADYIGSNQINLRWTDNSTSEVGFIVEQCRNKNCSNSVEVGQTGANVTTYLDTGLLNNTQYVYRVRAINNVGDSAYSNSVMVKTLRR